MSNFNSDLRTGKYGERMAADILTSRGHKVIDKSNDYEYQRKDIDFVIQHKDGGFETTLEIKTDVASQKWGNFFIETYNITNKTRNYKGWFDYCQAVYIGFVQPDNKSLHLVLLDEVKDLIKSGSYKKKTTYNGDASGYCVPVVDIAALPSYQLIKGDN